MSYSSVRQALGVILTELVGPAQLFNAIYGNTEPDVIKMPALIYKWIESDGEEREDSVSNEVQMRFVVRAVVKMDSSEAAETELLTLVDAVSDKLREAPNVDTLNGAVHSVDIERVVPWETVDSSQPMRGFDLVINMKQLTAFLP